jgi:hypothetical protein
MPKLSERRFIFAINDWFDGFTWRAVLNAQQPLILLILCQYRWETKKPIIR